MKKGETPESASRMAYKHVTGHDIGERCNDDLMDAETIETEAPKKGRLRVFFKKPGATVQLAICAPAFLIFLGSLILFGAQARGYSREAWYWSAVVELSGAILLIYPTAPFGGLKEFWRCKPFWITALLRSSGAFCIGIGFFVMHTAGGEKTQHAVAKVVVVDSEISNLDDQIARMKKSIADEVKLRDELPRNYIRQRDQRQASIDRKNTDLTALQDKRSATGKRLAHSPSAQTAVNWGHAEDVQRVLLILLAVLSGHGMVAAVAKLFELREAR